MEVREAARTRNQLAITARKDAVPCDKIDRNKMGRFWTQHGMNTAEISMQFTRLAILFLAGASISACSTKQNSELDWARAALERNPQIKVLAADAEKNTIQVRIKATGEVVTVTPGELAAIPIGDLVARASASTPPSMSAPAMPEPAQPSSAKSSSADSTTSESTNVVAADEKVEAPTEGADTTAPTATKPAYTVQREDGKVRVTGPGISIESNQSAANANAGSKERFNEPIICDGKRLLHVDGKRLKVSGTAIVARGGCELHITNSFITASGTGVLVENATVHIVNSEITGGESSLTSSSGARVLYRNSQFSGLARRDANATIQDQGGNTWR